MTTTTLPHVRHGAGTVRPYLFGSPALRDFVRTVFEATEVEAVETGNGGAHVEMRIDDSVVVLEVGGSFPPGTELTRSSVYVYVRDVDAVYARAMAAGATSIGAPEDKPYGERGAGVKDPFGNTWWIATHRGESPAAAPPAIPPGLALYQISIGHYVSRALDLAAKLGVADLLADGARDAADLAGAIGAHAPSLRRVLRLLASVGIFAEDADGRIALEPLGELLREGVPGSMRASVMLFAGPRIQDSWRDLEYCVRTGEPAFRRTDPDADPFTAMAKDPEAAAIFDKAMATFAPMTAAAVAGAYDFSSFGTIADVGGGNGALLIGILRFNPALRGILFDQPHVVERAHGQIADAGLTERISVVGGSFFGDVPAGADAYLLKHVIHDWNDEDATAILERCRAAMPAHGRLLIVEGVYPAHVDRSLASRGAAANDVNMLVCTGGRQRSKAEFEALFAASGLRLTRIVPTMAPVCVIEGERENR